ncbi:MAG: hypothetical protein IKS51_10010 [Erysipelotrichaceae bacterium]|nr:hypothetical protein [Erysipelotrichaceae bacterium]
MILNKEVITGLLIPLIGTSAGAACVFFLKKDLKITVQKALTGFAAGVMVAASIWSLIVPAIEQCADKERWAFYKAFFLCSDSNDLAFDIMDLEKRY